MATFMGRDDVTAAQIDRVYRRLCQINGIEIKIDATIQQKARLIYAKAWEWMRGIVREGVKRDGDKAIETAKDAETADLVDPPEV